MNTRFDESASRLIPQKSHPNYHGNIQQLQPPAQTSTSYANKNQNVNADYDLDPEDGEASAPNWEAQAPIEHQLLMPNFIPHSKPPYQYMQPIAPAYIVYGSPPPTYPYSPPLAASFQQPLPQFALDQQGKLQPITEEQLA
jgi:hypothetical protein